jgi:hypothetical protein
VVKKSIVEMIFNFVMVVGGFSLLIILILAGRPYLQKPTVWFLVSMFVFFICIGGIVHNILHDVPLVGSTGEEVEYVRREVTKT